MTQPSSPFKSTRGLKRISNAAQYSWQGLRHAFRYEAAFRQELALLVVAVPLALWLSRSLAEFVLLTGVLLLVLIVELLNSALEAVADAVTLEHHPLIGRAKDLGSAAVFMSFLLAAMVWLGVLITRMA
jgi:diacylglycerol kinase (ATP)